MLIFLTVVLLEAKKTLKKRSHVIYWFDHDLIFIIIIFTLIQYMKQVKNISHTKMDYLNLENIFLLGEYTNLENIYLNL